MLEPKKARTNHHTNVKVIISMLCTIALLIFPTTSYTAYAERYNVGDEVLVNSDFWWVRNSMDKTEESKAFQILDGEKFSIISVKDDGWYEIGVPGRGSGFFLQIPWGCDEYFKLDSAAPQNVESISTDSVSEIVTTTTTADPSYVEPVAEETLPERLEKNSFFKVGDHVKFDGIGWKTYMVPLYGEEYYAGALTQGEEFFVKRAYAPWYYISAERLGEVFLYLENPDAEKNFSKVVLEPAVTILPVEVVTTTETSTEKTTTTETMTTSTETTTTTEMTTTETTETATIQVTTAEYIPTQQTTTATEPVEVVVTTEWEMPRPDTCAPEVVSGIFSKDTTVVGDVYRFNRTSYAIHNGAELDAPNLGFINNGDAFVVLKKSTYYPNWYIVYDKNTGVMGYIYVPEDNERYFNLVARYSFNQIWYDMYK